MEAKIKSIKTICYHAIIKSGVITKGERRKNESFKDDRFVIYNKAGEIIEHGFYSYDDETLSHPITGYLSKYNTQGQRIESYGYREEEPYGLPESKTIYRYDSLGRIESEETYEADYLNDTDFHGFYDPADYFKQRIKPRIDLVYTGEENYRYDDNGNHIETTILSKDWKIKERYIYSFDELGNEIGMMHLNSDMSIKNKSTHKFDERGNGINVESFDEKDSLDRTIKNKYDKNNNNIEFSFFNADGDAGFRQTYEYDNQNRETALVEYNSEGIVTKKEYYVYEENKAQTISFEYNEEDGSEMSRTESFYDKHNNCIKTIEFVNDIPQFICESEIEYFDKIDTINKKQI